ncbi:MAG: hypothetical protein OER86_10510 [Phycisphaerae bacterium]|nr:hypothetical protein [Phycisphaerae bacterium]
MQPNAPTTEPSLKLSPEGRRTRQVRFDLARDRRPTAATTDEATAPLSATDPRWVLAVRTSQKLQGHLLTAPDRGRLIEVGRLLGLSAFESNLVIAVVQEQARGGLTPDRAAGLLRFVPEPQGSGPDRRRTGKLLLFWGLAVVAVEVALILALV